MILHIIAAVIAALLALTGLSAEDETLSLKGVVTDECFDPTAFECQTKDDSTTPPSELPGPSARGADPSHAETLTSGGGFVIGG